MHQTLSCADYFPALCEILLYHGWPSSTSIYLGVLRVGLEVPTFSQHSERLYPLRITYNPPTTERFNKEAMNVPNLSDQEHIQAYKHGLRSLSLTKLLATKKLYSVDDLLDVVHEFIKGDISVESRRDHLENLLGDNKNKSTFRVESSRSLVRERLTYPNSKPYPQSRS